MAATGNVAVPDEGRGLPLTGEGGAGQACEARRNRVSGISLFLTPRADTIRVTLRVKSLASLVPLERPR